MADIKFEKVGIKRMSACVPKRKFYNADLVHYDYSKEEVIKIIQNVGIEEKRITDDATCASDLCVKAAESLFAKSDSNKSDIDVCIFLSQSPDYKSPATSTIIQSRLGLSNGTICFDVNLACSGYVYGLSLAFMYASMPQIKDVLLLVGETFSKVTNPKDRVNFPLYGDAGTATIVGKGAFESSYFNLNSNGVGFEMVKINAGQCRVPFTEESLKSINQGKFGAIRDMDLYMDGLKVFNFVIKNVPSSIKKVLNDAGIDISEIDDVFLHQANKFMTDFLVKKLKIDKDKNHYSIRHFGNTSSASIPLTIVTNRLKLSNKRSNVLVSGFGAGMSWASALVSLNNANILDLVEYD